MLSRMDSQQNGLCSVPTERRQTRTARSVGKAARKVWRKGCSYEPTGGHCRGGMLRQGKALDGEITLSDQPVGFGQSEIMNNLQRYRNASQRALVKSLEVLIKLAPSTFSGAEDENGSDAITLEAETPQTSEEATVTAAEERSSQPGSVIDAELVNAGAARSPAVRGRVHLHRATTIVPSIHHSRHQVRSPTRRSRAWASVDLEPDSSRDSSLLLVEAIEIVR